MGSVNSNMDTVIESIIHNEGAVQAIEQSGFSIAEIDKEMNIRGRGNILANVTDQDVNNLSPENVETIKSLIALGCEVNCRSLHSKLSLYNYAIWTQNVGLASLLLDLGAKPLARSTVHLAGVLAMISEVNFKTHLCSYKALENVYKKEIAAGMALTVSNKEQIAPLALALSYIANAATQLNKFTPEMLTPAHILIAHGASLKKGRYGINDDSALCHMRSVGINGNIIYQILAELDKKYGLSPTASDFNIPAVGNYFLSKQASQQADDASASIYGDVEVKPRARRF